MSKKSAGLLLYRLHGNLPQVMLVHPGGPLWKNKEEGVWSIPKGEYSDDEDPLDAAFREFHEETGLQLTKKKCIALTPIKQKSGKWVYAWAMKENINVTSVQSNLFELEWPPHSGKKQYFPEVDKAAWFSLSEAKQKINPAQIALIEELARLLEW